MESRSWLLILGLLLSLKVQADGSALGVRAGGGEGLDLYSVFSRWQAPWLQEQLVDRWLPGPVQAYWGLSVEYWEDDDARADRDTTEVFIAGPVFRVDWPNERLHLLFGVQPSYLTHRHIGDDDLGGNIQFTSHIELAFDVTSALSIGLRGQHISNGGLYRPNPGMNLASVTLSYHF